MVVVLPWVLLLAKVPPLLLVFDPLAPPLQHHRGWVQIPCRMRVQIPVLNTSFPPCEQFTNLRSSAQLGMRKLRSSLLAPIPRNPLCCLGCQLMSNRFAQLAVGIRFWMNCAICAVVRSTRCLPEGKGSPGRRLSCSLGWLNGLGVAGELYHDLLDAGLSPFACSRSGAVRWVAAWSFRPYRRWACSFILAAGCGLAGLPDRVRVLRPVLAVVGWQVCRFGCGVAVMAARIHMRL